MIRTIAGIAIITVVGLIETFVGWLQLELELQLQILFLLWRSFVLFSCCCFWYPSLPPALSKNDITPKLSSDQ